MTTSIGPRTGGRIHADALLRNRGERAVRVSGDSCRHPDAIVTSLRGASQR